MSISSSVGPVSGIDYGKLIDGLMGLEQKPLNDITAQIKKVKSQSDSLIGLSAQLTALQVAAANFTSSAIFRATTASSSNAGVLAPAAGIGTPTGSYTFNVQRLATTSQVVTQGYANATAGLGMAGNLTFGFGQGNLDAPLKLADLNGGKGVAQGSIRITDGTGAAASVDLSKALDLNDVVAAINTTMNVNVVARIDGDRLVLTDRSGGTGNFSVTNVGATTTATDLGFTAPSTTGTLTGTDINRLGLGTNLGSLNNGNGVRNAGVLTDFTINSSAGAVDVSINGATTIGDVIARINAAKTAGGQQPITAAISADGHGITLTDHGAGAGAPTITAKNGSLAARDLGLLQPTRTNATPLRTLNSGAGVGIKGSGQTDFLINSSAGPLAVSLDGATTIGDVLAKINAAGVDGGGNQVITAALSADGQSLTLTDSGGGTPTVTAQNGSTAAANLGLAGGTLTGGRLNAGLNSALLSDLNGGRGVNLGDITLTDRAGVAHSGIDLSSAKTVADVVNLLNAAGAGVNASLTSNGTGILLTDTTGSAAGSITVADGTYGTAATDLGLAQTATGTTLVGNDAHLRYVSDNTPLTTFNGGFKLGKIKLTDSTGSNNSFTVDLSGPTITTIGDVLRQINNNPTGIRAAINANGNGIVLTDTSSGGSVAKVEEVNGGQTATSLNLLGSFNGGKLDGGLQDSVAVLNTDSLNDVVTKINQANMGVIASVINDGSGATPYRLSLVSRNSGAAGNLLFDGSALKMNSTTLVQGQDAVVSYGSGEGALQARSGSNSFSNLVSGLTLNLTGVGSATVTVGRDDSKITDSVQSFVDSYNKVINNIADLTKFNASDPTQNGVLFGDSTIRQVEQGLAGFVTQTFSGVGQIKNLGQIGISVGQDGTLTLDQSQLGSALANNPDDVRTLFTRSVDDPKNAKFDLTKGGTAIYSAANGGVGAMLSKLIRQFTDSQTGLIFQTTDALANQTTQLNTRSQDLNDLLTMKKQRLVTQFSNLEVTIAKLQQQGSALASFKPVSISTSSSNSNSNSSSG